MKLAIRELRNNPLWSILGLIICFICFNTVFASLTNIGASVYQRKEFEENINIDLNNINHLYFNNIEENEDYIARVNSFIKEIKDRYAVGRYDQTGEYFLEIKDNDKYININQKILNITGSKYNKKPDISRVIYVDEEIFNIIKGINIEYDSDGKYTPIYVSESFKEIIPSGTLLTSQIRKEQFEVCGYIDNNLSFFDENDIIRFPLISLDGYFIAPLPESYDIDIMSTLSTLHNVFVISDVDIREELKVAASEYNLDIEAILLSEEYSQYKDEEDYFVKAQTVLAVFISIMALSSLISIFSADTLLKKRDYGIYLSNGYSRFDVLRIIFNKIMIIVFSSIIISYSNKYINLLRSDSVSIRLFKNILIKSYIYYSLPMGILLALVIVIISVIIPAVKIFSFEPHELISGENNR
ncbi:MAG: hypothetical protein SPK79_10565 [Erysipelotrichaceae bacterium]|nr:hypothetical protein [Erysipelotrichaceae bacterium]